jgi:hypothetical protein
MRRRCDVKNAAANVVGAIRRGVQLGVRGVLVFRPFRCQGVAVACLGGGDEGALGGGGVLSVNHQLAINPPHSMNYTCKQNNHR